MGKRTAEVLLKIYREMYEHFGPQHWWPGDTRTEIIVGAVLTQNTNWRNVEKALANLRSVGLLNFPALKKARTAAIAQLIRPSGYYNMKARRLKNFVAFFYDTFNGSWRRIAAEPTASLRKKILAVNGIGPETADSILLYALDRPVFVVDAYTRRIFSRYGLTAPDDDYDTVQSFFMDHLPRDPVLYNEYHALIVRLAKEHCRTRPLCPGCPSLACRKIFP
ncbi:MAG: endonuclease III domain-containing protein [Candidatus Omnitrophota bacterium]